VNAETLPRLSARGGGGGGARRLLAVATAVLITFAGFAVTAATTRASVSASSSCTVAPAPTTGPAATESFYQYTGTTSLCAIAPGTVLKTRTIAWHVASIALPVTIVQLLYRTTNAQDQADTDVTSVLLPPGGVTASSRLIGYGSYYDSLNPEDEPSVTFAGAAYSSGTELTTIETTDLAPLLLAGDTVSVADTEGQTADFAAGTEYGYTTLDGIRAALNSTATNLSPSAKVALVGYSGGAIATSWAAQEAPSYAPNVESRLVGASMGGLLVDPDHNLHYIEGSSTWAGVMPMSLVGLARAYGVSFSQYLSANGNAVVAAMQNDNINEAEDDYAGITWSDLAAAQYPEPEDVPPLVTIANRLILGSAGMPKVPEFIAQGTGGQQDGTDPSATYGAGDGVMIAGDVRTYSHEVCASGDPVDYQQFTDLSHEETEVPWLAETLPWLTARFSGAAAPQDCSTIAPGNSLAPVTPGGAN
jgi:Secretory lipase